MKAAVCREFNAPLVVEELNLAPAGDGEIEVEMKACAICHSDIFFAEGKWGGALPAVYGHEAAGIVTAVGQGVHNLAVGDHVVVTLIRSCGQCHSCSLGVPVACSTTFPLDEKSPLTTADGEKVIQAMRSGAFAERVVVGASQAVKVPADLPFDIASLLACGVITGFGAVANTADMRPGSDVVVIGAGGVGLNTVQGAAILGARNVIAVDIVDAKLEAARRFGATHVVNSRSEDAVARVREICGGRGADYVFVTVGVKSAFDQSFAMAARVGAVVLVGMPPSGVMTEIDPGTIASASQRILGSKMGGARIQVDIPFLIDLYRQGRLKLDELISGRYRLEEINEAMASVNRGEALRNVIMFD